MTQTDQPTPPRRSIGILLKILLGLLVLSALVVALLPFAVQWYLEDWLRDRGVVNVSISDVDINPFVGRFTIQSLEFEDDRGVHKAGHAELNLNWTELANQRIRLSQLELRDAILEIQRTETNGWLLGTIVLSAAQAVEGVETSEQESGWGFGIDQLRIENVDIDYQDPLVTRSLKIDSLALDDFATWNPTQATTLEVTLSSGAAELSAAGQAYPFADTFELDLEVAGDKLDAAGLEALLKQAGITSLSGLLHTDFQIKVSAPPDAGMTVAVTGELALQSWALTMPDQSLAIDAVEWAGDLDVGIFGDTNTLAVQGSLQLADLGMEAPTASVRLSQMNWQGLIAGEAGEQGEGLSVDGELRMGGLQLKEAAQRLVAGLESLVWQGQASTSSAEQWRPKASGEISAGSFSAGYLDQPPLLSVGTITAQLMDLQSDQIVSLGAITLVELNLLNRATSQPNEQTHVLTVANIELDTLALRQNDLAVGEVLISDMQLWLERAQNGSLMLGLPETAETSEADVAADTEPDDESTVAEAGVAESEDPLLFSLAGVKTIGESALVYLDRSVRPVARLELKPFALEVGEVNAARPDADTAFRFAASEGRYGRIAFNGTVRPLAQETFVNGTGTIKDINMIKLDGFARRAIGYQIESGTLSSDLDLALQGQLLDSSAELTIRKLMIDPLDADEQDEFSTELGVPLGTALGLLEDDQETIRLTIPMQGDLADLSVGVGDAIRLVMKKGLVAGMQTAATTYFAPLWPALAATKLYSAASALRFQEVTFTASESYIDDKQRQYLKNMAGLLAKRPKVNLTVCARTVQADVTALFPDVSEPLSEDQLAELAGLADERQLVIKDGLIDAGIDSARLVTCTPEVRPDDEGLPRVVFGV